MGREKTRKKGFGVTEAKGVQDSTTPTIVV